MEQITIKVKSTASDIFQISIDNKVILKVNHPYDNTLYVNLESGKRHILVFYVEGKADESYSIEVAEPANPPIQAATLGNDLKDYGYIIIDLA